MSEYMKRKNFLIGFTFIILLAIECIISAIIFKSFFIRYPLLEISLLLIMVCPGYLFKSNRNTLIYESILLLIMNVLMLINVILDYASDDVFSIKYLFLAGEAAKVFSVQFINIWYILIFISVFVIYYLGIFLVYKKFFKTLSEPANYRFKGLSLYLSISIIALILRIPSLARIANDNSDKKIYSDKTAVEIVEYSSNYLKRSSLSKYGLLNYSFSEIKDLIELPTEEKDNVEILDDYFEVEQKLDPNEFSGLLKDMNVITIMIESGIDLAINKDLTPNLYQLQLYGINFTNNHSKNKTNVSELIGIMGSTAESVLESGYNNPYAMPKVLKDLGYSTSYFHCNSGDFYNRDVIIDSLGFDNSYFMEDYDPELSYEFDGNYPLDSDYITHILNDLVPEKSNKPFYSFYTTLSTHGPYNEGEINMAKFEEREYYKKIHELEAEGKWENPCKDDDEEIIKQWECYQCQMMDLDKGIGLIIDRLEKTNQLDNTLLILYGDHEVYYRSNDSEPLKNYIYDIDDYSNPIQYRTTMMMYNPKLNKKYFSKYNKSTYDEFTSPYIIVPTALELLGVDYNMRHYLGTSIFQAKSELDNVFYTHELKILFSDLICANDINEFEYCITDDETYLNEFDIKSQALINKIDMFNLAYRYDYFYEKLYLE